MDGTRALPRPTIPEPALGHMDFDSYRQAITPEFVMKTEKQEQVWGWWNKK